VIATASNYGVERARELGADIVIDHTAGPWDAGIELVDLVFDTAGGERLARSPGVLREGGRLVTVAEEPPQAPGVSSVYFVVEPNRRQLEQIAELLDGGWPPPAIDSRVHARGGCERLPAQHGHRQAREGRASGGTVTSPICRELREGYEAFKRRDLYDLNLSRGSSTPPTRPTDGFSLWGGCGAVGDSQGPVRGIPDRSRATQTSRWGLPTAD
jgi:Zinc-binding dehydrogenase